MPVIAFINGNQSNKIEMNEGYDSVSQVKSHIEKVIGRSVTALRTLDGKLMTDAKPLFQYSIGRGTHMIVLNAEC